MVDEIAAEQIFRLREDGLQRLLEVRGIVREGDDANLSALPGVLVIEFGDGHVEARAEAVLQATQNLAFVFKGMRVRNENFQSQQTDRHSSQLSCCRNIEERSFGSQIPHPLRMTSEQ